MNYKDRIAGVLLPISSLPSPYGIGTLGKSAFQFVDFLKASQAKIWQMLPLNVTSYGDSPYQSPSSNGLNYYFIDFDILNQKGLLKKEEYQDVDFGSNPYKIDYGKLFLNRVPVLKLAFNRFDENNPEFVAFEKKGEYRDFAFFMTLKV
ncbi:MAG: 4-alpha-glucanotransferase, partial [Bacilli bacterium]